MQNRKYFFLTLLIISLLISSVIHFNYKVDSLGKTRKLERGMTKIFFQNKNVEWSKNIKERWVKKSFIEKGLKEPVDLLITGSSRIMQIDSSFFPTKKIFNAGVSGAGLEDQIAFINIYQKKFGLPKEVIITVDPWIFNKGSDTRYRRIEEDYFEMKQKIENKHYLYIYSLMVNKINSFNVMMKEF